MAVVPDVRLQPPKPSRLWRWWLRSTTRAVIRKVIGLTEDCALGAQTEAAYAENARRQAEVIRKLKADLDQLATYAVDTQLRLAFYEQHAENLRYLKTRYDGQHLGSNGGGLVLLGGVKS